LLWAAEVIAIFGPYIRAWREEQWKIFDKVKIILLPISGLISRLLPPSVSRVAAGKRPAHIAFGVAICRWPDMALAGCYIQGIGIIDDIESSGVFRALQDSPGHVDSNAGFFGTPAIKAVDTIMARQEPRDAGEIWAITLKTAAKGSTLEPVSRETLDMKYGKGNWRPMPTFLVKQSCGKARVINDAKAGEQNSFTKMRETIFAISVDFCSIAGRAVLHAILEKWSGLDRAADVHACVNALPDWARLEIGLTDVPDAYNGTPCKPAHLPANISAVFDPECSEWKFVEQEGLGFGLTSAVVGFCRLPAICTAVNRRVFATASADYVDDLPTIDIFGAHGSGQASTNRVLEFTGTNCHAEKTIPMGGQRVFLGVAVTTAAANEDGHITFSPKEAHTAAVIEDATAAIASGCLSRKATSSLRGKANWTGTNSQGRLSRIPLWQLRAHTASGSHTVSEDLAAALEILVMLNTDYSLRCTRILGPAPRPLIVYSDASWEPAPAVNRIGWIIFDPRIQEAAGFTMRITSTVTQSWIERKTQIVMAEAFATIAGLLTSSKTFANRDVVWFIDNEAACGANIRGTSGSADLADCIGASVCLAAELGSRIWYEWIDTAANAADGLSRCGTECPIAQALCATITEVEPLVWQGRAHAIDSLRSSISP
jgi:hypothetical protein